MLNALGCMYNGLMLQTPRHAREKRNQAAMPGTLYGRRFTPSLQGLDPERPPWLPPRARTEGGGHCDINGGSDDVSTNPQTGPHSTS